MGKILSKKLLFSMLFVILAVFLVLFVLKSTNMALVLVVLFILFAAIFIIGLIVFSQTDKIKNKWIRGIIKGVFLLVYILFYFSVAIDLIATASFFHPNQNAISYKELLSLKNMSEVTIQNSNNIYSGWFVKNTDGKAPLVIFFGGNRQCASQACADFQKGGYWTAYAGYNFMAIDYPGYGRSSGSPSEEAIFKMALLAYDYATTRNDVDGSKIVVEGYSLGTGAAAYLASQRSVTGLILIAPFDQALSMYNSQLDIFHGPLKLLASYHFNSTAYAKNIKIKPLIITSTSDELINYKLSENLAKYFPTKPDFHLLNGLRHNDYLTGNAAEVPGIIASYLQKVVK